MSQEAAIENYKSTTLLLIKKWADTYNFSDRNIEDFTTGSIMALMETKDKDINDLKEKNEVCEELEFLVELMKEQHIRHNIYTLT